MFRGHKLPQKEPTSMLGIQFYQLRDVLLKWFEIIK